MIELLLAFGIGGLCGFLIVVGGCAEEKRKLQQQALEEVSFLREQMLAYEEAENELTKQIAKRN